MRQQPVWSALLVCSVIIPLACSESSGELSTEPAPSSVRAIHQKARSTNKVLILGSSVNGGLQSREAQAVAASDPTAQIDVVTPAQWQAMTAEQLRQGSPSCEACLRSWPAGWPMARRNAMCGVA